MPLPPHPPLARPPLPPPLAPAPPSIPLAGLPEWGVYAISLSSSLGSVALLFIVCFPWRRFASKAMGTKPPALRLAPQREAVVLPGRKEADASSSAKRAEPDNTSEPLSPEPLSPEPLSPMRPEEVQLPSEEVPVVPWTTFSSPSAVWPGDDPVEEEEDALIRHIAGARVRIGSEPATSPLRLRMSNSAARHFHQTPEVASSITSSARYGREPFISPTRYDYQPEPPRTPSDVVLDVASSSASPARHDHQPLPPQSGLPSLELPIISPARYHHQPEPPPNVRTRPDLRVRDLRAPDVRIPGVRTPDVVSSNRRNSAARRRDETKPELVFWF